MVACPACHAEFTLDVLLPAEEQRIAVGRLVERSLGLGSVAMRYLALFRPEKRRMSIDRMVRLANELFPDLERQAINRKGRDWPATKEVWMAGMDVVLAKRDKGTLTLPLTGHGLLYEVMCGLAEKVEAAAERQREEERRNHRPNGPVSDRPRNLAGMVDAIGGEPSLLNTPVIAAPVYSGPSKAALRIQAENKARLAARQATTGEPE